MVGLNHKFTLEQLGMTQEEVDELSRQIREVLKEVKGEVMHDLMGCPFCGAYLLGLRAGKTLVHPDKGCILDGFQFSDDFIPEWEKRDGEPKRCCANCVHHHPAYGGGYIDCDLIENPQLSELPCETVCYKWEGKE